MLSLLICLTLVAACGDDDDQVAEPTLTSTPLVSLATATMSEGGPTSSPRPGEVTVGQIADRITAAWPTVRSYRATSESMYVSPLASPVASPVAATVPVAVVDEVVQPDRRHRYQTVDGRIVSELVLVDGIVYLRGIDVAGGTPVAGDPGAWLTLDPNAIEQDSPYRSLIAGMTAPIQAPYSGLSEDERNRIARPAGAVTVGERRCDAFRVADTTMIGERIEIVIALGDDGLPCSIETRVSGNVNITTFEYNLPLTIEPPN